MRPFTAFNSAWIPAISVEILETRDQIFPAIGISTTVKTVVAMLKMWFVSNCYYLPKRCSARSSRRYFARLLSKQLSQNLFGVPTDAVGITARQISQCAQRT